MYSNTHTIRLGDTSLLAHVCYDDQSDAKRPAVLLAPSFKGLNNDYIAMTQQLAEWGYVGIAIDIYGDGQSNDDPATCKALMQPFVDDRGELRHRLLAHYAMAQNVDYVDSEQIAIMGFCFGGTCAMDLARSNVPIRGAISIHGNFLKPEGLDCNIDINTQILYLHGYQDPLCPPEGLTAFAKECETYGAVNWQCLFYGQDKHAYTDPKAGLIFLESCVYNEQTTEHTWRCVKNFLSDVFD